MKTQRNPNHLDSFVFRKESPQGTCWIQIAESEPGKIEKIILSVGKGGSAINAFCFAVSELATKLIKSGQSVTDIIIMLSGIKTDRHLTLKGMEIYSPIDALVVTLMQYRSSVPEEIEKEEKLSKHLRKVR